MAQIKIGINGFGRIGRMVFRAACTQTEKYDVVGINDLCPVEYLAYMLKYDTMHGQFNGTIEFDTEKKEPAFLVCDYWLSKRTIPAEKLESNLIRIKRHDLKGTIGNTMVFGAAARYNPCFFISDCAGINIHNVNIWHCGGMGVIAQRSRDIELLDVEVVPSPGKGRIISITADATHFVNCAGYIRMIDCKFCNQKDDATNVHGLYMAIDEFLSPDKVVLKWRNSGQHGVDFLKPGMKVEIVNQKTIDTYCYAQVKAVEKLNDVATVVTFAEALPEGVEGAVIRKSTVTYPTNETEGEEYIGKYLEFLSCGGRISPLDSLKVAGIDMSDPTVVDGAIEDFASAIAQFREIYNKK